MRRGGRSFFEVTDKALPRAFHAKARSYCTAAVLDGGLLGVIAVGTGACGQLLTSQVSYGQLSVTVQILTDQGFND